jgi:hypothetical protein
MYSDLRRYENEEKTADNGDADADRGRNAFCRRPER